MFCLRWLADYPLLEVPTKFRGNFYITRRNTSAFSLPTGTLVRKYHYDRMSSMNIINISVGKHPNFCRRDHVQFIMHLLWILCSAILCCHLYPLHPPPTGLSSRQPRPRPPASIRLNQHSARNEVLPTNVLLKQSKSSNPTSSLAFVLKHFRG